MDRKEYNNILTDYSKFKLWKEYNSKNCDVIGGFYITLYLMNNTTKTYFISFEKTNSRTRAIYESILLFYNDDYNTEIKSIGTDCRLD